jgi:hypothetical protein
VGEIEARGERERKRGEVGEREGKRGEGKK